MAAHEPNRDMLRPVPGKPGEFEVAKLDEGRIGLFEDELDKARGSVKRIWLGTACEPFPYARAPRRGLSPSVQEVAEAMSNDSLADPVKATHRATMAVLDIAAARGIPATVLTAGVLPRPMFAKLDPDSESNIIRDELTLLCAAAHPENEYGIILPSSSEEHRERQDPPTVPYAERIASLKALQEADCKIWECEHPWTKPNPAISSGSRVASAST